jgi:hypothetical protein
LKILLDKYHILEYNYIKKIKNKEVLKMRNLKNLAVVVVIIIMLSACSQKRTPNPMSPIVEEPITVASDTETNTPTDTFTNTVTTDTPTERTQISYY